MPVDRNDKEFKNARKEANKRSNRIMRTFVKGVPQKVRKNFSTMEKKTLRRLITVEILNVQGYDATIADVP